eukprot:CAMPEP_0196572050 /NCGR_PEP_ID=MMETSP1081-20130531/2168_1 /TAXON_ID=36882 /ORGANISM="Pyramimonas amylifera, Strain CCMP720" /LENGTH=1108 /DNA_ID=CAMNT_0041889233 /DNA_START=195 /DNA_END=3521 /DNA_ORIENTATION=-
MIISGDQTIPCGQEDVPSEDITVEGLPTAASKPMDESLEGSMVWNISEFSKIRDKMHYSDPFVVGGHNWRVMMFPKGNNAEHLSLYLDVANSADLPYNWSHFASFKLSIRSHFKDVQPVTKDANHQFTSRESDWGFTQFMSLADLHDPNKGYIQSDCLVIDAHVSVRKQDNFLQYDSKKETGFVGLKNQGATCYMNSLLQTLFHLPYFRKAVYHMPTTEEDIPSKNIPLALQSLFYKVQFNDLSVATKDLTRSFGWDANESFMQHDVQELNRVLCEKLEEKMKSTTVEGTIQKLFEGEIVNYIECVNVEYKSTRTEAFQDLQLDVKGCKNVYESFDKYVEVEELSGDNKYRAEGHGLQDAKKGVLFEKFPPVLQLQLKRFEYDFQRDQMVKINERYEFPSELDLDVENHKYLTPTADKSVRNLYRLHSVLVHSGGVHGGHYYAYIRPDLVGDWFKFDDERVTKEDEKRALEEQYGGDHEAPPNVGLNNPPFKQPFAKFSNAYMLVYIRTEDTDRILCSVTKEDIAPHLLARFKKESEEKERKRKEKAEAHLYTIIKVAQDLDLKSQIGKDLFFDLVDHEKVRSFRVQKQTLFGQFKEMVAAELGIPVQCQRYWLWAKRQNHTYRPSRALQAPEEALSVVAVRDQAAHQVKSTSMDLKLYLEEVSLPEGVPRALPPLQKGEILLFFKLYEPATSSLRYVGKMFANLNCKMVELKEEMLRMAGFPESEDLLMFEEIKFDPNVMCETVDRKATLRACQLEDGDIICFQRNVPEEEAREHAYGSVPEFLEYIRYRQVVQFRKLEKPKEEGLVLELSKQNNYEEVTTRLAQELGLQDPTLLRLTGHNGYSHAPRPHPFKFYQTESLHDMLTHCHQLSDIMYYEVLDIPLPELERLKILKLNYHNKKTELVCDQVVRMPKESCVEHVLDHLKTQLEFTHKLPNPLRMLEVCYHRIYKVFQLHEKIDSINDQYWILRVEEIPDEQLELQPSDRLINVYHFNRDTTHSATMHNFGEPFLFKIGEKETLAEVKQRIQAKLEVPDEEFEKWNFAFCSLGKPEFLTDAEIVCERFASTRRDWGGQWEYYLGLEHEDKGGRRPASQSNRYTHEKPVKIWN